MHLYHTYHTMTLAISKPMVKIHGVGGGVGGGGGGGVNHLPVKYYAPRFSLKIHLPRETHGFPL